MNSTSTDQNRANPDVATDANDFSWLPEPLRVVALDTYRRLIGEGRTHDEAVQIAGDQAREWEASRSPAAKG